MMMMELKGDRWMDCDGKSIVDDVIKFKRSWNIA